MWIGCALKKQKQQEKQQETQTTTTTAAAVTTTTTTTTTKIFACQHPTPTLSPCLGAVRCPLSCGWLPLDNTHLSPCTLSEHSWTLEDRIALPNWGATAYSTMIWSSRSAIADRGSSGAKGATKKREKEQKDSKAAVPLQQVCQSLSHSVIHHSLTQLISQSVL